MCDAFEETRKREEIKITNFTMDADDKVSIEKPLWIVTVYWLIRRNLMVVTRDPTIQKLRILQKMVSDFWPYFQVLSK